MVLGLLFLTMLCQIELSLTMTQPLVQVDFLKVPWKPLPFLHRRSTRANHIGNGSRWIPMSPKLRKSLEGPYFDERAMNVNVQHPILPNIPRPMSFHHYHPPHHAFPMLRPSQLEPQHSTNHKASPMYGQPSNLIPSSSYLPASSPSLGPTNQHFPSGDKELNNPSESELRFLFHRPEDENLIKSTILNESDRYNERVTFVRGPTLKFQRHQTIYLPPKKKSVIYIMLKEPQVQTDLEVIEPPLDPTPEVNILYEKAGTVMKKHYFSTAEEKLYESTPTTTTLDHSISGHHLSNYRHDLGSSGSEVKSVRVKLVTSLTPSPTPPMPMGNDHSAPTPPILTSCQPNLSQKLKKR